MVQPQEARTDSDFWRRMGPGLFDLGTGIYSRNQASREADSRLRDARGPLYDANTAGAQRALAQADSMDPKAAAAERFNAQQGLLAGPDAASEDQLMRMLYSRGLLGVSNYNPGVEGIAPGGPAMNPHVAAFYAARNARNSKMAADSLDAGEAQLDRQINRAGMLQGNAARAQQTGIQANGMRPSRAAGNAEMLRGIGGILKDTDLLRRLPGMIGSGVDWLRNLGGGGIEQGFFTDMDLDW